MSRPNSKWFIIPALVLAVVAAACGGGGEEKTLLTKYFMASKVSDNMTLSNIATVAFDPKTDGQMMSFNIVNETPDKVEPLGLKQHAADLKAATDAEKLYSPLWMPNVPSCAAVARRERHRMAGHSCRSAPATMIGASRRKVESPCAIAASLRARGPVAFHRNQSTSARSESRSSHRT